MSTKSSLAYVEVEADPITINIYYDLMDGKFYLETNEDSICLPEDVARKFAEVLND